MLKIKNLKASIEETEILRGIDLEVNAGEVHEQKKYRFYQYLYFYY